MITKNIYLPAGAISDLLIVYKNNHPFILCFTVTVENMP